jgi:ribonuclease R
VAQPLIVYIRKLPHGRANLKQLVRERARLGESRAVIEAEIARLVETGALVETRAGHYTAVGIGREYATGKLHAHRDGYAFVTPDIPISGLKGDIYIPKEGASHAMHGDRVVVRLGRIEPDGRGHGEILRVLRRAHNTVVGEFRVGRRGFVVVPHDDRLHQWIEIPEFMAIPKQTASPDRVGPAPKTVARPEDLEGMIVTA